MSQNNVTHMIENPLLCDTTWHRILSLISVTRCVSTHICPRIILDLLYGICTNFTFYHTDCTRTDFTVYHRLYNECWLCTALCGIYTDFTLYRWLYNVHWLYSVLLTLQWVLTLHCVMWNIHWLYSVPLTVQCALTLLCTTDFARTDFALYYWLYNVHWLYTVLCGICTDFTLKSKKIHANRASGKATRLFHIE